MEETKKQLFSDNIILVVLGVLGTIGTTYEIFFKQEMPRLLFAAFFIALVSGFVKIDTMNKNKMQAIQIQYENEQDMLLELDKGKKKHFKKRLYEREKKEKALKRACDEEIARCKKHGTWKKVLCIALLVGLCWRNPENVKAFGEMLFTTDFSVEEAERDNPKDTEEADSEDVSTVKDNEGENNGNTTTTKEAEFAPQRIRAKGYYFVLDNPDCAPKIRTEIKQQVYFYQDAKETKIEEAIPDYLDKLFSEKKTGIEKDELEDQFGNTFYTYTNAEDSFKQSVMDAFSLEYYDDWEMAAPSSYEYDALILGRESLCSVEKDGKIGNYEVCWKLANDYQYYAQEYERQTENKQAILYYYTMSIHYCIEALQYDMDEATYDMIYEYMVERYHDLARDEACISDKYKERAQEIWDEIKS